MQQQLLWWAESGRTCVLRNWRGLEVQRKTTSQRWHETWTPEQWQAGLGRCSRVWVKQLPQRNLKWLLVVNWGILVEKRVFFPLLLPLVWSSQSVPKLFSAVMWSRKSPCLKTSALPVGNGSRCKSPVSPNKRPSGSHRTQPLFFQCGLLQISAVVKPVKGWTIGSLETKPQEQSGKPKHALIL